MGTFEIVFGIIILVLSVIIVALVLCQSGKEKNLSGAIAGGADTFFAKGKTKKRDKILSGVTTFMSFALVVLVVVLYIHIYLAY